MESDWILNVWLWCPSLCELLIYRSLVAGQVDKVVLQATCDKGQASRWVVACGDATVSVYSTMAQSRRSYAGVGAAGVREDQLAGSAERKIRARAQRDAGREQWETRRGTSQALQSPTQSSKIHRWIYWIVGWQLYFDNVKVIWNNDIEKRIGPKTYDNTLLTREIFCGL